MPDWVADQLLLASGGFYALVIGVWIVHAKTISTDPRLLTVMHMLWFVPAMLAVFVAEFKRADPSEPLSFFGVMLFAVAGMFCVSGLPLAIHAIGSIEAGERATVQLTQPSAEDHRPTDAEG